MQIGIHDQALLRLARPSVTPERWAKKRYAQAAPGWWRRLLRGAQGRLLLLAHATAGRTVSGQRDAGLQQVAIRHIDGSESEGRCADFDGRFRPLNPKLEARWLSVAMAWHRGIELPPVSLIQVGNRYFVRDGHHRISVAAAVGQEFIPAFVISRELAATGRDRPQPAPLAMEVAT